jgi:cytochrome P450
LPRSSCWSWRGFDTTVNLIASGTLALLTHPGEKTRLRQDPSLLPAAVEELLRFTNPVNHANDRFTTEDVPVGDGVHRCLGAPLARMEAEVALGALLARFPRMSLAVPQRSSAGAPSA